MKAVIVQIIKVVKWIPRTCVYPCLTGSSLVADELIALVPSPDSVANIPLWIPIIMVPIKPACALFIVKASFIICFKEDNKKQANC